MDPSWVMEGQGFCCFRCSGVAAGSSCQMALLVTPFSVLVGWAPWDAENPEVFFHGTS